MNNVHGAIYDDYRVRLKKLVAHSAALTAASALIAEGMSAQDVIDSQAAIAAAVLAINASTSGVP